MTVNYFENIKDIIVSIAATVTAAAAAVGVTQWRKELRGRAKFDASRNLLRSAYRLRDSIAGCRAPFVRAGEFPPGYTGIKATPDEDANAWAHVYESRFRGVRDAAAELLSHALEGEVILGKDIREPVDNLHRCAHALQSAISAWIENKASAGSNFASSVDFAKSVQATLFSAIGTNENPFTVDLTTALGDLESKLRQHLER